MWWLQGDYEDLNRAMVEEASVFVPPLLEQAHARQREADVARAHDLLAKHGLEISKDH